jgi:hypothetical protein
MKIKTSLLILLSTFVLMVSSVASAAVINSGTISGDVIVTGANDLEFVYGSVTSPNAPCCSIEVTLSQGFRLPTVDEIVNGFGTLTSLLGSFNLLDDDNSNNIVAFEYFNNLDVSPTGDIFDVRSGYINNLNFGDAFYDYAGSAFRTDDNSEFFFVRAANDNGGNNIPEPATLILFGLGLIGLVVSRKKKVL